MSSSDPLRAAILDLDGTLVHTIGDFESALHRMLDELGLARTAVDRAFVHRTIGKGSEHLIRQTLLAVGADEGDPSLHHRAMVSYQHHYAEVNGEASTLFEGVLEGLQVLRAQGWPLVCLTNKPAAPARELLRRKALAPYFEHVFGGDDFPRKKPDPLPLIEACRVLGYPPAQVLMVGDSLNDAQAAEGAGCPLVLMTYGYNHGQPVRDIPARAHLDRLDHLATVGLVGGAH